MYNKKIIEDQGRKQVEDLKVLKRTEEKLTISPANIRLDEGVLKTSFVFIFRRRLHTSSEVVFKTSSKRLNKDQYTRLGHTSSRRLQDVFKTSSRRFQNVFKMSSKRFQDIFKTFSRRFQNVFKTFSKRFQDIFKTFSRRFQDVSSI